MFNFEKMQDPKYRLRSIKNCIWIVVIVGILATIFNIYTKQYISCVTTGIIYIICGYLCYISYIIVKLEVEKQ